MKATKFVGRGMGVLPSQVGSLFHNRSPAVHRLLDEAAVLRKARTAHDLLPITEDAVALPLPSYSLKVVEQYVGFERQQEEYGGQWAMAKYIEAVETEDEATRADVMAQILAYNREDLAVTWAVLQWLKSKQ